jgi:DNA-binding transcriptional MerR regulator
MTLEQLAKKCGLSSGRAANWTEAGLILPVTGRRREFGEDQIQRVLVILELQRKGVELARLAGRILDFPSSERYIVFDDRELRACPDAEAAIAVVTRARRACIGVDLASVRRLVAP